MLFLIMESRMFSFQFYKITFAMIDRFTKILNLNGQRGDAIFDLNFRIIMDVDKLGIYFDFILGIKIFIRLVN